MRPCSVLAGGALALLLVAPAAPGATIAVPVVLDVKSGTAWYRTELTFTNRGASPVALTAAYTGSIGGVTGSITDTAAALTQRTIPDAVAWLREGGLPFPDPGSSPQVGTLLVTLPDAAASSFTVVARTTSATSAPQPIGNAGLAYLGLPKASWATGSAVVYGLRADARDRSNLAVYNPTSSPVTLRVRLASGTGDGREAVIAESETLAPGGWRQWDGILLGAGMTNGWAVMERVSGEAFGAYGVVNDNGTNDGSFIEPVTATPARARLVVPVLVETPAFRSELVLANRSASVARLTLEYREALYPSSGAGGSASLTLQPREQRIVPEVTAFLRSLGIAVGAAGAASYAGSLRVTADLADPRDLFAGARVSSLSPASGSFGVFFPGLADAALATDEAFLAGLRSDSATRTNVALLHAGDAASGALTLEVQAYDGARGGVAAGSAESVRLEPGEWRQLTDPLRARAVATGWARVKRFAGSASWSAYAVVNDGGAPGERTGDGAFVPAVPGTSSSTARLQPGDLEYLGAFRLPGGGTRPDTFEYGGNAMTFRPGGDPSGSADGFPGSLFVTAHDRLPYGELPDGSRLAEVSIPAPSLTRDLAQLPKATLLQPYADVSGGLFSSFEEIQRIGLQYLNRPETGPKIHMAWGQHVHLEPTAPTHGWCEPTLSAPATKGAWYLGNQNPYAVNGYMLEIPASWANANAAGRVLGTGRFRDGGWSGMGPELFAYRPWSDAGAAPPAGTRLSETVLLKYATSTETDRIERCMTGYQHPDEWEGGAWVTTASGKTALLFAGTKSVGAKYWYGFINPAGADLPCVAGDFVGQFDVCRLADGTPCPASDLTECAGHTSNRGWWSTRFAGRFIFYDPADLSRVAQGALETYGPQPYASLDVDDRLFLNPSRIEEEQNGTGVQRRYRLGDVTFDRASGLLYLLELYADEARPVVHVFRVR